MMSEEPENPFRAEATPYHQPRTWFGMSHGAMAGLVVLTVACGLVTIAVPALGIPAAILLAPPYIRASMGAYRYRLAGKPLTQADVMALFGASFLILSLISLASSIAFGAICVGTVIGVLGDEQNVNAILAFGLSFAGLAALATFWLLARVFARLPVIGEEGDSTVTSLPEATPEDKSD